MFTHSQILDRYKAGKARGKGHSLKIDGDVLYSYTTPLVVRLAEGGYLVNGDRMSMTTAHHQSSVFHLGPQVPYSAIQSYLDYKLGEREGWWKPSQLTTNAIRNMLIQDRLADTWDYMCGCSPGEQHPLASYNRYPSGCPNVRSHHTLGATLLRAGEDYLLSTIDPTQRRASYSLILLPKPVATITEALTSLMPPEVLAVTGGDIATSQSNRKISYKTRSCGWGWGRARPNDPTHTVHTTLHGPITYTGGVLRQGDLWLVSYTGVKPASGFILHNQPVFPNSRHIASQLVAEGGKTLVTGRIRHPEHGQLNLSGRWYACCPNTAVMSWAASGGVD